MRVLGVDLGSRRIGLAVGIDGARIASPRKAISSLGSLAKDAEQVVQVMAQEQCERLVIGLPKNPSGPDKRERITQEFVAMLGAQGIDVITVDEALTSIEAVAAMAEAGLKASQRRERVDSEAACRILERYFAMQAGPS